MQPTRLRWAVAEKNSDGIADMISVKRKKKVVFVSSYAPRRCGIATFTSDLIASMAQADQEYFEQMVIAMESDSGPKYRKPVKFTIRKNVKHDYIAAVDYINFSEASLVSVQHEFGLFGGYGGCYLNLLLQRLNKPIITTLHTVLEKPSVDYFESLTHVCDASDKVIVMNKRGISMLKNIYAVAPEKIELIPHGIPDLPFGDSETYKKKLNMAGRRTILTFGLLNRNKGIEVMLRALPRIVKIYPDILYIVLGATHPEILRHEGQSYKLTLEKMVAQLGLERNVIFHNRFVTDAELSDFLGAADVYVTPYLHKQQLTSGTLAFAVGAGKAVVSTPYWAAQELLAGGRGRLVRFADSKHTAQSIIEIFDNTSLLYKMRKRAYDYGRARIWAKVGQAYWKFFCENTPTIQIPLRPRVTLRNRNIQDYNRRTACQTA